MTKVLATNSKQQMIFNSFSELKRDFETSFKKINIAFRDGVPLQNKTDGSWWYIDELFEIEKPTHNA